MEFRWSRHSRADNRQSDETRDDASDKSIGGGHSIAIVGLACRYPDADDAAALFDLITSGRRAFRRIPPSRVDLTDYHSSLPLGQDASYHPRAALIEGWRFDRAGFGLSRADCLSADPAFWLAWETASKALAAAGCAPGAGLAGKRGAAFVGTTVTGEVSVPGGVPGTVAAALSERLGLSGGGFVVDAGDASSLAAVASACSALARRELDVAVAGGIDLNLDALELAGLAKSGLLASGDMRIYDENPTGFLPGEGCGMVVLMRASDARAADLPIYASILGWGIAPAGPQQPSAADPGGMLRAMRRAYGLARLDPADVQLIEGCGAGVPDTDEAELIALTLMRAGTTRPATISSVTASIGHARAAAGAAGLIKTVLAAADGVLPPSLGIVSPHQILADGAAGLRVRNAPEPWPAGPRFAGVSAHDLSGLSVHLVLGRQAGQRALARRSPAKTPRQASPDSSLTSAPSRPCLPTPAPGGPLVFFLQAADRKALAAVLARVAEIGSWLSDAELVDLACQLASEAANRAGSRIAIVAASQEQLAKLARQAIAMLPDLPRGLVRSRQGIFAADHADGRVVLLFGGPPVPAGHPNGQAECPDDHLNRALAVMRRLDTLGVRPAAAVGHGLGELAGLVWAGCVSPADAKALSALRAAALDASLTAAPGSIGKAIDEFAAFQFSAPQGRLISGCTGSELRGPEEIASLLSAELLDARSAGSLRPPPTTSADAEDAASLISPELRLASAVRTAADGVGLLLRCGRDSDLTQAIDQAGVGQPDPGKRRKRTVVDIDGDPTEDRCMARAVAALFAAGALATPELVYSDRQSRPFDIWRDQVFITQPGTMPEPEEGAASPQRSNAGTDAQADAASSLDGQPVPGVATWHRCYVERATDPAEPVPAPVDGPWRIYTGGCEPFRLDDLDFLSHEPTAGRTLALLGRPHDAGTLDAALQAAHDAIRTSELVAISPDPVLAGFWASLHAEHPSIGITTVRARPSRSTLRAASRIAAEPGKYRELAIEPDGSVRELVMAPTRLERAGGFLFGQDDVVLISRSTAASGLALAQVLACCGTAVAVVGGSHPGGDDAVVSALEQLRLAGAEVRYEIVDLTSAAALEAAVGRIQDRLGPVTAVAHAVGAVPSRRIADLAPADINAHVAAETRLLAKLVAATCTADSSSATQAGRLRLVITFGSVSGRYGLAEEGLTTLADGALADYGAWLAAASPGCRAVHVDWPAWSGINLGEQPDAMSLTGATAITPMPVHEGSRLLLKLFAAADTPARSVMHGRIGQQAPRSVAVGANGLHNDSRFTARVLVHYPGVELITEATIGPDTDPYLADYQVDGEWLLPPMMAVEAMAQVASALAGKPLRFATDVSMAAPIVGPASAVLRICALAGDDSVSVIIRSDSTSFAVDHFRASFELGRAEVELAPTTATRSSGGRLAAAGSVHASHIHASQIHASQIHASQIYGPVCFQSGRFAQLTTVEITGSKVAAGRAEGPDGRPWFTVGEHAGAVERSGSGGQAGAGDWPDLLLGRPGLNDAALQLVQISVPHRRLMFAGCESAMFGGRTSAGIVTIKATATGRLADDLAEAAGEPTGAADESAESAGAADESAESAGEGETLWDVEATDADGSSVAVIRGLRMRSAGPLSRTEPWPPALIGCLIERAAPELGLPADLEVAVSDRANAAGRRAADGWVRAQATDADLRNLVLQARASGGAACSWRPVKPGSRKKGGAELAERWLDVLGDENLGHVGSEAGWAAACVVASCAGAIVAPADASVTMRAVAGRNWLVVRSAQARVACALIEIADVGHPVAIAIMTGARRSAVQVPAQRSELVTDLGFADRPMSQDLEVLPG
jgi:enediyne polyketide synthase